MSSYVRYIDRTRDYYLSKGYDKPYQWAHFEDVPFTPLKKPLAESRVVLVTTSDIAVRGMTLDKGETDSVSIGGHYSMPSDTPIDQYYSDSHGYDRHATTLEDIGAFFPVARLREALESGRIGGLTKRFHNACTAYSQRRTREQDAPEILRRCLEDGAEVAVLTPV
jgi:D-proline reductase (dithiol) PrdB